MCGIAALQLRNPALRDELGVLMHGMLCEIVERGPDSAGLAVYGDRTLNPDGTAVLTLLGHDGEPEALREQLASVLPSSSGVEVEPRGDTTIVRAGVATEELEAAVETFLPGVGIAGRGTGVTVMKGVGNPRDLAETFHLREATGLQGVSHTRMATESAVTAGGAHPFTVADDLCLVHNGSFSNHVSIRRRLEAEGVRFDSENDSEVAARYIARRLEQGDDLETALAHLGEVLDGFYTLVVTTATSMAVVRDPIACKPAIIAETDDWVAMASEYRALAGLPGIEDARIFEPAPGIAYTWTLSTPADKEANVR
ncbi:glutamine amidotransferase [Raineyella fluvialis]|uniref:glutamine--fructose-6-phosphate transaminase (isomerizing) n=1 Tax=Raineyella fluvialis TaxID=2662261 RepID=A0A5Q2FH74_9ACTN|nr:glutamine amidotransferase [Raineyella fluvialis]QGF24055.1 glutamine amidotransferase [Raineyella fluvialis]